MNQEITKAHDYLAKAEHRRVYGFACDAWHYQDESRCNCGLKEARASLPSAQPSDVVERVEWWKKQYQKLYENGAEKLAEHGVIIDGVEKHMEAVRFMESAIFATTQQAQSGDVQKLVEAAGKVVDYAQGHNMREEDGVTYKPVAMVLIHDLIKSLMPLTQNKGD